MPEPILDLQLTIDMIPRQHSRLPERNALAALILEKSRQRWAGKSCSRGVYPSAADSSEGDSSHQLNLPCPQHRSDLAEVTIGHVGVNRA